MRMEPRPLGDLLGRKFFPAPGADDDLLAGVGSLLQRQPQVPNTLADLHVG